MKLLWLGIFGAATALTLLSLYYVARRLAGVFGYRRDMNLRERRKIFSLSLLTILAVLILLGFLLNTVNAAVCLMHLAALLAGADLVCLLMRKLLPRWFSRFSEVSVGRTSFAAAAILTVTVLSVGWYLDHHVWRAEYTLYTAKPVRPFKAVLLADAHLGTTFDAAGFREHLKAVQAENPDIIFLAGDIVDDDTAREDMIAASRDLGRLSSRYGTYMVHGNHEKGYYGAARRGFSAEDFTRELENNGVRVLLDENVSLEGGLLISGRKDLSVAKELHGTRLAPEELLRGQDLANTYAVALDHQPFEYDRHSAAGFDLVLSGHTHGGQLFPFNEVGRWLGAVDLVYGHEKRAGTDFIVTSGISDWSIRFKTGTKSEYVVINVLPWDNR
ncbi:metallophosphoesterase [Succinimonas sp.]|uniref:metallophosphoesterase n=1 Tax=Succinimonas sp. TaxID=1936151 RepID=UPI0038643009